MLGYCRERSKTDLKVGFCYSSNNWESEWGYEVEYIFGGLIKLFDDSGKDEVMRNKSKCYLVINRRRSIFKESFYTHLLYFLLDGISPNHLANIITRSSSNPINTVIFIP